MSFEHVEYKTARAFWEAHKALVAEGCSLAVLTLPLSRTVGFVEQERRRYHSIGVSKYKATNGQYLPGGWGLLANSVGPGDAGLLAEILAVLQPARQTLSVAAFKRGLEASGLPEWVQESVMRDAESSGILK